MPETRQLSIFGAETTEPSPADLAGLLAGPGRLGRMGGTARVTVRVDAAWRVHVLVAELVRRGLVVTWRSIDQNQEEARDDAPPTWSEEIDTPDDMPRQSPPSRAPARAADFDPDADSPPIEFDPDAEPGPTHPEPGEAPAEPVESDRAAPVEFTELSETPEKPGFEVLTAYSRRLDGLARTWQEGAAQLFLSGPRLRLWVAASGEPVAAGYALGLNPGEDHRGIGAALVRAGLSGQMSPDGRRYVITGRRRLARLAELVGDRPSAAPPELWPQGAGA